MKRQLLMTPGPTPVPEEIMKDMAAPVMHHRTPEYREVFKSVSEDLKYVFKTERDCFIFTSSGTGAMEASVVNLLSPGDKAIAIRGGKFGERYYEICEAYGVDVIPIDIEWGTAPAPGAIKKALSKNRGIKAVFTELCETSTATIYDVRAIGGVVKEYGACLVVDAISGLGADDLQTDAWGVDVAVGGSQKALMLPPGLSFCTLSEKAWEMVMVSKLPKFYYDFKKYRSAKEKNDAPFTPAITLTIGLRKALDIVKSRGIDDILKGCAGTAEYFRQRAERLGFKIFSGSPSNGVTALKMPEGTDAASVIKVLRGKGIIVAGGQARLKGKIIRVAHMGGIRRQDIDRTLCALKEALEN